jgi:hypothetical protein
MALPVALRETGFGIEPMISHARLPDRVEACGRRQPTEPVLKRFGIDGIT